MLDGLRIRDKRGKERRINPAIGEAIELQPGESLIGQHDQVIARQPTCWEQLKHRIKKLVTA